MKKPGKFNKSVASWSCASIGARTFYDRTRQEPGVVAKVECVQNAKFPDVYNDKQIEYFHRQKNSLHFLKIRITGVLCIIYLGCLHSFFVS